MKKHIRSYGIFSIATGAMISSGIFILPSLAFAQLGPAVSLAYLVAGLFALAGSFSIIELATAMPRDGGDYYYIHRTFGGFIGSISGLFGWVALSLKSAFAIFGISEVLLRLFAIPTNISAIVLCIAFVLLNAVGTKEAIIFQNVLVFCLLSLLALYCLFGLIFSIQQPETVEAPGLWRAFQRGFALENFSSREKLRSVLSVSGFVFISFGGLLKVTNISGEVAQPKRDLPLGMSLSIIIVTFLYTLINIILVAVMVPETLSGSLAPVADSARRIMAGWGQNTATVAYYIVIFASLLAFITTANAGIMAASRYPMALSRDQLLPPWIAKVHPRHQTPIPALILTGLIIIVSLFLPLATLVKAASAVVLNSYILTNLALIIFRESRIPNYQPSFSAPLYPWLQIICIGVFGFFLLDIGSQAIEVSLLLLALSLGIYYGYGRRHSSRSFALVYLLKRIVDRNLEKSLEAEHQNLEAELLELLLHRDEVQLTTFQKLAQTAEIQDLPYAMTFANMLKASCPRFAAQANTDAQTLEERFMLRQQQGTTAFSPFLAIPHLITPDEHTLFMHVIRSKEGIYFDENHTSIKAIFLLGGGAQKRHEHLECLAAIATLAEELPQFEQKWLGASNASELRNLLLSLEKQSTQTINN